MIDYEDIKSFRRDFMVDPKKTIFIALVFLIIFIGFAYLTGYLGEMGKQQAISKKTNTSTITVPEEAGVEKNINNDEVVIHQQTQGVQSPAVISKGDVTIQYDTQNKTMKE